MIELIPIMAIGTKTEKGVTYEIEIDSTQVFEVYDVTEVNTQHNKYRFLGTVIRGKSGWMSILADEDKVQEHKLRRDAIGHITKTERSLSGQARGSKLG